MFDGIIPKEAESAAMERKDIILRFLADHQLALPQMVIFRNLKFHHEITFSYSTVDNKLDKSAEEGLVQRIDPEKLRDGELVDLPGGKENRSYYIITDKGRKYVQS
jgi:DNA-binding PadR family transcriptional regulator